MPTTRIKKGDLGIIAWAAVGQPTQPVLVIVDYVAAGQWCRVKLCVGGGDDLQWSKKSILFPKDMIDTDEERVKALVADMIEQQKEQTDVASSPSS